MTDTALTRPDAANFGVLLRLWRTRRRFSQLELSTRSGVSTRHLSFVETGRARPTAEMVLKLSDHLDVPLSERDRLLLAAGFAPRHGGQPLTHDTLATVMSGLRDLLDAHLPYPALLLDEHWDIVDTNSAAGALMASCLPELLEPPINVIRVSLHPDGLAPRIRNLPAWAGHLRRQVEARLERTHDPRLAELVEELSSFDAWRSVIQEPPTAPVVALELEADGAVLRMFSVATLLEMPTDSTLEGLHLETFLPADEETRTFLQTIP